MFRKVGIKPPLINIGIIIRVKNNFCPTSHFFDSPYANAAVKKTLVEAPTTVLDIDISNADTNASSLKK
jgi:hypothetical protein